MQFPKQFTHVRPPTQNRILYNGYSMIFAKTDDSPLKRSSLLPKPLPVPDQRLAGLPRVVPRYPTTSLPFCPADWLTVFQWLRIGLEPYTTLTLVLMCNYSRSGWKGWKKTPPQRCSEQVEGPLLILETCYDEVTQLLKFPLRPSDLGQRLILTS